MEKKIVRIMKYIVLSSLILNVLSTHPLFTLGDPKNSKSTGKPDTTSESSKIAPGQAKKNNKEPTPTDPEPTQDPPTEDPVATDPVQSDTESDPENPSNSTQTPTDPTYTDDNVTVTEKPESTEPTPDNTVPTEQPAQETGYNMAILRFESQHTFGENKDNSEVIAPLVDIYDCSFYYSAVIPGVHAAGGEVIAYRNFLSVWDGGSSFQEAVKQGYALVDQYGNYVYEQSHPENKVMDPGSQLYRQELVEFIKQQQATGYDGVFADNAGFIYPQTRWLMSARPINPRTGLLYTDDEWLTDAVELLAYVKSAVPEMKIITNGMLYNGYTFYKTSERPSYEHFLSNAPADGLMVEGIFNNMGVFYSEQDWLKSVELVRWLQDNYLNDSDRILVLWSQASYGIPTWMSKDQASLFIYASSLLGVSRSGQNYVSCHGNMDSLFTQSLYNLQLGAPLEDYHLIEGTHAYTRRFSKATIIVNPTQDTYTVNLSTEHQELDGSTVSQVTLSAYEAKILLSIY